MTFDVLSPENEWMALAVALGIGLLIGAERERRKGTGPTRRAAGIRTFALAALLGALAGTLGGEATILVAGLAVGALALSGYLRSVGPDPGLTTEVALVVTFFLGVLATRDAAMASAFGVVVAALLAGRDVLQRFVREVMTEEELHDLLLLAAAALVVLPLLPDRTVGPLDVFNPFNTWRLVVLVMAVSGAGYVALRALGPRLGLPAAGLAGGFVSSSATIASLGTLSRDRRDILGAATAGAVLSSVATFIQMGVVLGTTSVATAQALAIPVIAGGTAALLYGGVALARLGPVPRDVAPIERRPFSLWAALTFAGAITAITFAAAACERLLGAGGVTLSAAVGGFADTHAAAASVGTLVAEGRLDASEAVLPVVLALSTNIVTKAVAAFVAGRRDYARQVSLGLALILVSIWLSALAAMW